MPIYQLGMRDSDVEQFIAPHSFARGTRREVFEVPSDKSTNQSYITNQRDRTLGRGIARTIIADNGVTYHLPPAEYNYQGPGTIDAVLNAASTSAQQTGRRYAVFVTEASRRTWVGLEEVQARRPA